MAVFINGVADQIPKTLLTTTGDIIAASAANTPARVAAPASGLVLTGQGAGVLPAWAAASTGALTRAGGNTTEATTTSTTRVSLITSTVSIGANVPCLAVALLRKTTGAADDARTGLTLNATAVTAGGQGTVWCSASNRAEPGYVWARFQTASANYAGSAAIYVGSDNFAEATANALTGNQLPIATITSVIFGGAVDDALITMGADEMHVYTYAVS